MAAAPPDPPGPAPEAHARPEALLELAVDVATRAGRLLLDGLSCPRVVEHKSTPTDHVTDMDRAAEALVVEGILAARPHDAVVGEEGGARPGTSGVEWFVDPIDGTTNYVYGHPGFAVSVAAAVGGRTVAGAVYDPLHGDLYTATLGGGSHRNGERLELRGAPDLARALVATGFSYEPDRRRRQSTVLSQVLPLVCDIRRMGAASVDLCSVAAGRVDAFYEKGLAPWDQAAGSLVAAEAGARVGDLVGGPPSASFVLAAPPHLFDELAELLLAAGADQA